MTKAIILAAISSQMLIGSSNVTAETLSMSLAGEWRLALDPDRKGEAEKMWNQRFEDSVPLPGTLAEHQKGPRSEPKPVARELSSEYAYTGVAWYQTDLTIPKTWEGRPGIIHIERSKISKAWLGSRFLGSSDALGAPQEFAVEAFPAGEQTLTVMVDSEAKPPGGAGGHMITTSILTNWNGLLGKIEARVIPEVEMQHVTITGDVSCRIMRLGIKTRNRTGSAADVVMEVTAKPFNSARASALTDITLQQSTSIREGDSITGIQVPLGENALMWDEFDPGLYDVTLRMKSEKTGELLAEREYEFGLRDFKVAGNRFIVNGRKVFLRGKHEALLFPLTGYAPTKLDDWMHVMKVAKDHGINHYRFHSCTPPDADFRAANRLGIYMQPELYQFGGRIEAGEAEEYHLREGLRILDAYGHHASFVMFALGNEIGGDRAPRERLVSAFRAHDPTRLYAQGSNNEFWDPMLAAGDEYWTTARTSKDSATHAVRGSFSHADKPLGHVQNRRPDTMYDFSAAIAGVPVPVIGHETGQYQVSPGFNEIARFQGVQKPWNLVLFRQRMEQGGMLGLADDFVAASGALAVLGYREEIESALRTPGFGGFQLLDLQDFPGQGTALVGVVDSFMESKGLISPEKWREFCGPVVPLARFESYTWTSSDVFKAAVEIANYGPSDIQKGTVFWRVLDDTGSTAAEGELVFSAMPQGEVTRVGEIELPLSDLRVPARYELLVELPGSAARNSWPLWIYPEKVDIEVPAGVRISTGWDNATRAQLAAGETVLLLPDPNAIPGIEGFFMSDFWCYPMFRSICENRKVPVAPGTLGLLVNAAHPAYLQATSGLLRKIAPKPPVKVPNEARYQTALRPDMSAHGETSRNSSRLASGFCCFGFCCFHS